MAEDGKIIYKVHVDYSDAESAGEKAGGKIAEGVDKGTRDIPKKTGASAASMEKTWSEAAKGIGKAFSDMATNSTGNIQKIAAESVKGEEKYEQAIKSLNRENEVLESEMKKVEQTYKNSADSLDLLKSKAYLYNEQMAIQKEKVSLTREALEEAQKAMQRIAETKGVDSEEYEEAAQKVNAYRVALNDEETAQIKLQQAIDANNEALKKNSKAMDDNGEAADDNAKAIGGLGDQLDGIAKKLGISIPEDAKKALNSMEGFSVGTVAAMGAAAGAIAALYKSVKSLYDLTLEAGAWADDLLTRSAKTGLSTDLLQELDYASKFLDFEGLEQTLVRLTNAMDAARDGAKNQSEAFAALGVSVTDLDGNLLNNYDVFLQTIDALGQIENETERDVIANDLFGKSFSEMKPLINAGSAELKKFMEAAKENGYVLSEDQVKKLGEVDDAHQELQKQIEATKNILAAEFAPAAKSTMETFANATKKAGETLVDSKIIENLGNVLEATMAIFRAGESLIGALPEWANPIQNISDTLRGLAVVMAAIADTVDIVAGIFSWDWDKVKTAAGYNINNGQMSNLQKLKYSGSSRSYQNYYEDYDPKTFWTDTPRNASGTRNWKGGPTWVGENGPELLDLPAGTQVLSSPDSMRLAELLPYYASGAVERSVSNAINNSYSSVGGSTYYVYNTIDAQSVKSFNDVVRIMESAETIRRMY